LFERFTDRARRVVVLAQQESRLLNHNYIGTEHILLGLLHEGEGVAARALELLGIDLVSVRQQVTEIIGQGDQSATGHVPFTPRAKKVLELSLRESRQLGHNYIGTEHILLGLIREGEGVAAQVLQRFEIDLPKVRQQVIELLSTAGEEPPPTARLVPRGPDRIEVRGLRVFGHHGAMPEEQQEGQEFLIDVTLHLSLAAAGASDQLEHTVDYHQLAERVAERVAEERWNLLERVAERVAELAMEDRRVHTVEVTVRKPQAPVGVPIEHVAVTIIRER
jgi:dihydroneopterin aldolase